MNEERLTDFILISNATYDLPIFYWYRTSAGDSFDTFESGDGMSRYGVVARTQRDAYLPITYTRGPYL